MSARPSRIRAAFASLTGADWALQFVRFVAVVAGILIAFALDGWNSNRLEKIREDRLMERLLEESERGTLYLRDRLEMTSERLLGWQRLAISLSDNRCPAADAWPGLHLIDRFPSVTPPIAVANETASSIGDLNQPELREALAGYRARLNFLQAETRSFDGSMTLLDPGDPRYSLDYEPSAEETVVSSYNRTALCRDRAFRDRLILAVRDQQRMTDELARLRDDAVRLCTSTAGAIGRECRPGGDALTPSETAVTAQ